VKLFLGGLSWDTDEADLRAAFEPLGGFLSARIARDKGRGSSRGFGFVTVADMAAAGRACGQSHMIRGRAVEARVSAGALQSRKLFVGGLHPSTGDAEFLRYFEAFGKVTESQVVQDRSTGKSRGFGFVSFSEEAAARAVLELGGGNHTIRGKRVEVKPATPYPGPAAAAAGGREGAGRRRSAPSIARVDRLAGSGPGGGRRGSRGGGGGRPGSPGPADLGAEGEQPFPASRSGSRRGSATPYEGLLPVTYPPPGYYVSSVPVTLPIGFPPAPAAYPVDPATGLPWNWHAPGLRALPHWGLESRPRGRRFSTGGGPGVLESRDRRMSRELQRERPATAERETGEGREGEGSKKAQGSGSISLGPTSPQTCNLMAF